MSEQTNGVPERAPWDEPEKKPAKRGRRLTRADRAQAAQFSERYNSLDQIAKQYERLRGMADAAVDLTEALLADRCFVETKDTRGRIVRERVHVPLELRNRVREDVLDRIGMPRRTENDVRMVGEGAAVLLRVEGGLGWPAPLAEGADATARNGSDPHGVH